MTRQPKKTGRLAALADWVGVLLTTSGFIFVIIWAGQPDSAEATFISTLFRTFCYSVPITLSFWGISRATRKGSAIPAFIARTIPYVQLSKDGSMGGQTVEDAKAHKPPVALGEGPSTKVSQNGSQGQEEACGDPTCPDCGCGPSPA